jgi:WD40 repeat protein
VATEYSVFLFDARRRKQLWDRSISRVRGDYTPVGDVAISADGSCIAAVGKSLSSEKSILTIWRDKLKERLHVTLPAQPLSVVMANDSSWFAVGMMDVPIHIFDSKGGLVRKLKGPRGWPRNISVTTDSSWLAYASGESGVQVWNTRDWSLAWKSPVHSDCLQFDQTGSRLVTAFRWPNSEKNPGAQIIRVWDARKGRVIREYQVRGFKFTAVAISPDARIIACGADSEKDFRHHECILIDARSGRVVERLRLRVYIDWFNDLLFFSKREILVAACGHTLKPVLCWKLKRKL